MKQRWVHVMEICHATSDVVRDLDHHGKFERAGFVVYKVEEISVRNELCE